MKVATILFYMDVAHRAQQESYCVRKKVGAVLADHMMIGSYGYNGTLPGFPNVCEIDDRTHDGTMHQEENAILKLADSHNRASNMSMFVTCCPCVPCANKIIMAGIKNVFFSEWYRDLEGARRLLDGNVSLFIVTSGNILEITKESLKLQGELPK